jgi:hypothetical protein
MKAMLMSIASEAKLKIAPERFFADPKFSRAAIHLLWFASTGNIS